MALASSDDVIDHLGRDLTTTEAAQVDAVLDEASDLIIGYCRTDFEPSPYPGAVIRVTAAVASRALIAASAGDPFVQQQTAGPFSLTRNAAAASGDVWLTGADKIKLRPYRRGGGLTSVELVGERYTITKSSSSS